MMTKRNFIQKINACLGIDESGHLTLYNDDNWKKIPQKDALIEEGETLSN